MPRTDATGYVLLPTPTASDGLQGCIIGEDDTFRTTESGTLRKVNRNGIDGSIGLGRLVQMWKTPVCADADNRAFYVNSRGEPNLSAQVKLFPTPATDSAGGRKEKYAQGGVPLTAFVGMFPTPTTPRPHDSENTVGRYMPSQNQFDLAAAVAMLPTPTATMATHGGPNQRDSSGRPGLQMAAAMWPTPRAFCYKDSKYDRGKSNLGEVVFSRMYPTPTVGAPLCGGSGNYEQLKRLVDNGTITEYEKRQMAQQGGGQLNPDWVEWLMGVPQGWTDIERVMPIPEYDPHWYDAEPDTPRVATGVANRVDRLKSLGNMVDPYQFFPVMECITEILKELKG